MSYVGGKANSAQHILQVLNHPVFNGMDYVEPFVGYAHILRRVENKRSYAASDANPLLMALLRAVQRGKTIPHITAVEYDRLKHERGVSLRRAVAAFTYSFNGKEWGGYTAKYKGCASTGARNPPDERRRYYDKLYENEQFCSARLSETSYIRLHPRHKLIYCHPPYEDTTGYRTGDFDHDRFWDTMRAWSRDNIVFVSEYKAPPDFVCVTKLKKQMSLRGAHHKETRIERLFTHRDCIPLIEERADYLDVEINW